MRSFALFLILFSSPFTSATLLTTKQEFKYGTYTTVAGVAIPDVKVGYETYGQLNEKKSNVILITHFYSGTSHAAGKYAEADALPGYWEALIGPGKAIDTNKYFVISSDTLVNVSPKLPTVITTGPLTINPKTKKPYGMSFPAITVRDFVQVQKKLLESLGIEKLVAVIGPSGGAAQAVEWAVAYPTMMDKVVAVVGPGLKLPNFVVALLNRWVAPIELSPEKGVMEAMKLITVSSMSLDAAASIQKPIEEVLTAQIAPRLQYIDGSSVIYMARAMQSFNVENEAQNIKAKILFLPVRSDIIFPPEASMDAVKKLCGLGKSASVKVLETRNGHLDGLTGISAGASIIGDFLNGRYKGGCKK